MNLDGSGYHLLHSFVRNTGDGTEPTAPVVVAGSVLFGTTTTGGASGYGTVFSMNVDGSGYHLLHSFTLAANDALAPGGLVLAGSTIYGLGGPGFGTGGALFAMNTNGTGYHVLHVFSGGSSDGLNPSAGLTLSGSTLFGSTSHGGTSNLGTVFMINTDGSGFHLLHSFSGGANDGAFPYGNLTLDGSTVFGTTTDGGAKGVGIAFSISVPEPESLVLASSALLALAAWRRRTGLLILVWFSQGCARVARSSRERASIKRQ